MKIKTYALASVLLSTGCSLLPRNEVLVDRSLPHQLAADQQVQILGRQPDGTFVAEWIHAEKGDWIASPQALTLGK